MRTEEAKLALKTTSLKLVEGYPRCSQGSNAMENVWKILKDRLDETMPTKMEYREEFLQRLRAAVKWANKSCKDQLWRLPTDQKKRASACLKASPPSGQTRY